MIKSFLSFNERHCRQRHGAIQRRAAALKNVRHEPTIGRGKRNAQSGGRRFARGLRRTEQQGECPAVLCGEMQPAQLRIAHHRQPGEYRTAGVRGECLFGRP